jgi:hypothetical protein
MTGAKFGTLCPIYVANILVLFTSSLVGLSTRNGRDAYMLLFDHFLGPNNVGNMTSEAETKLTSTLYNGEKKRFTWETYVRIHTEQHSVIAV